MSRHTRRRMSTQVSTQVSTHASPPQAQCLATFCWALFCTWQANLRATHGQKQPYEPRSSHQPLWDFWLKVKVTLGTLPDPDLIQGFFIHCCLHGNLQGKHTTDVTVNTVLCFVLFLLSGFFCSCAVSVFVSEVKAHRHITVPTISLRLNVNWTLPGPLCVTLAPQQGPSSQRAAHPPQTQAARAELRRPHCETTGERRGQERGEGWREEGSEVGH